MVSTQGDRTFKKGSFIFIEGDEDCGSVFLVKKGRVRHVCNSPRLSTALKDAGEGDFFGFISAFSGRPRLSSAVAVEDTVAVQIDSERLFRMLGDKPVIAMKIMNSYSHALQEYDNVLMGIKPISLLYPQSMSLLRLGEYYMENGNNILADYIFNRYVQIFPDSENLGDVEKYICDIEGSV
jgi:CRP-like cAMP-binding protein